MKSPFKFYEFNDRKISITLSNKTFGTNYHFFQLLIIVYSMYHTESPVA